MTIDQISKLFLAHSIVRRVTNETFRRAGQAWKFEHFVFLATIPASKGIPLKDMVSAPFGGDKSMMRRLITDLEKGGLIQLEREAEDRRHLRIYITDKGLQVLATLNSLAVDSMQKASQQNNWIVTTAISSLKTCQMQ